MQHKRLAVNLFEHRLEHSRKVGGEGVDRCFYEQGRAVALCFFTQVELLMVAIIREYIPSAFGTDTGCTAGVEAFFVGSDDCYAGTSIRKCGSCTTGGLSVRPRGVKQRCCCRRTVQFFKDQVMVRPRYCDLGPIIYTVIPEGRR